jgi:ribosome recycling factor
MINEIIRDTEQRMKGAIQAVQNELAKVRTGRAHPSLLDHVKVDYYGSEVPLSQAAAITILDARTLSVAPWDKNMTRPIEKAIQTSDLGLNPATSGDIIRIPLPPLTEERRKDLIKVVHKEGESAKVAIRNVRRDALQHLKGMVKEKKASQDEERHAEEEVQKLTNTYVSRVDGLLAAKEKELMEI